MNEASKSKSHWGKLEQVALSGNGIDIGCGYDPVTPNAKRFDLENGDANRITDYVKEQFDFVFSSHCLEHMHEPPKALHGWWQLVKPSGFLFFIVPDEDLYEQGVFPPSRFNPDHKATVTIYKVKSWSPRSYNVLDLVKNLPDAQLIKLALNDTGYNRKFMSFGRINAPFTKRLISFYKRVIPCHLQFMERLVEKIYGLDQTKSRNSCAHIECIVQRKSL